MFGHSHSQVVGFWKVLKVSPEQLLGQLHEQSFSLNDLGLMQASLAAAGQEQEQSFSLKFLPAAVQAVLAAAGHEQEHSTSLKTLLAAMQAVLAAAGHSQQFSPRFLHELL